MNFERKRVTNLKSSIRSSLPRVLAISVISILLLCAIIVPFACGGDEEEPPEEDPIEEPLEPEPEEEEEEEEGPAEGEGVNPLTGLYAPEDLLARRILGVVIDNSPRARPHLGLTEADVIIEMLVEGGATRFLALYLQNDPEVVGPVRSARHYFLNLLESMDALLVHCGGSPQAYQTIRDGGLKTLDDLRGGGQFFRQPSPGVPYEHTLFTRMPENREQVISRELGRDEPPAAPWAFAGRVDRPGISGQSGQEMTEFRVKFPPGYDTYSTSYVYDDDADVYLRTMGGEPHADRESGEELSFSNIVILWARTNRIPGDTEGRLNIDLKGSGDALIVTGGKGYSGFWSAEDGFSLSGPRDREVRLTPGKTWIAIIPEDTAIEVEGLQP